MERSRAPKGVEGGQAPAGNITGRDSMSGRNSVRDRVLYCRSRGGMPYVLCRAASPRAVTLVATGW